MSVATTVIAERPAEGEFASFYGKYIAKVADGDVLDTLEAQLQRTISLLDEFGERGSTLRYGPDKWSVKQVVGHVMDAERIFAYRALCAARGESGALPGFDENRYVAASSFDARTLNSILGELTATRRATLALFRNMNADEVSRRVTANGVPVTVRALAWIIAGHEEHHVGLLRERYLPLVNG